MIKLLIGAVCLVTFGTMVWLTWDRLGSVDEGSARSTLVMDVGVTFAVGYGLFALADRLDFVYKPPESRGLLDADREDAREARHETNDGR